MFINQNPLHRVFVIGYFPFGRTLEFCQVSKTFGTKRQSPTCIGQQLFSQIMILHKSKLLLSSIPLSAHHLSRKFLIFKIPCYFEILIDGYFYKPKKINHTLRSAFFYSEVDLRILLFLISRLQDIVLKPCRQIFYLKYQSKRL